MFNRNSAEHWELFASHRERMTALVREHGGGRLGVLGAGNLNDLALDQLVGVFDEIHLVDLDKEALGRARARQSAQVLPALTLHAPVDVTGSLHRLRSFAKREPTEAELDALILGPAEATLPRLPAPFDCVLSSCLLGQIMHSCRVAMGESQYLGMVAQAAVAGHLRLLGRLCRPGGTAVLVTDTVSSETYPLVELWGERPPLELLAHLEESDNIFSGTGATFVRQLIKREEHVKTLFETPPRLVEPWLWRLGNEVTLLAYALVLRRTG
jgi:hypothetical protein